MTDRVIRVVVDSSGVTRGSRRAEGSLNRLEGRARGLSGGFRAAAAGAVAFVGALAVREVLQAVDAYQSLQNRLRVVTDNSQELAQVQQALFDISQSTRTSFEATTELYSRAAIAAGELGASQEDLLRLTEISGQALAIQGSSAAEASGALRQLSQSFASGIVRAEEFNSILEGAFPIAQAAARGIDEAGGSVGRLRQLVADGEITSREFFEAILEGGDQIDEQFGQTEATLSQAVTTISNSFLNFVGVLNDTTGAGAGLAAILIDISEGIDQLAGALTGTLEQGDEVSEFVAAFATALILAETAVTQLVTVLDATLGQAIRAAGEALGALAAAVVAVFEGEFDRVGQIFQDLDQSIAQGFRDSFSEANRDLVADTDDALTRILQIWDENARGIIEAVDTVRDQPPPVPEGTNEAFDEARDAADEFLQSLTEQTGALAIQAEQGDEAGEALIRYRENLALAAAENEIFGDLLPTPEVEAFRDAFLEAAQQQIDAQRAFREEIAAEEIRQSFDDQIAALEEEIFLLNASTEEIARNAEVRALAGGATAEQAARIRELTEELERERIAGEEASDNFTEFLEGARDASQDTLSGILADPLSEGLDELPFKFAQLLQQLAAEALAAEVFDILGSLGGGGAGGGGGGIGALVGSFFGGGFQAGGQVRGGQPILVGERGPELFTPPSSGAIQPNIAINQAAQAAPTVMVNNITDPADIPSGLDSAEGQEAVINIIKRNPDQVRRIIG